MEEVAKWDTCKTDFPSLLGVSNMKFESSKEAQGGITIKVQYSKKKMAHCQQYAEAATQENH